MKVLCLLLLVTTVRASDLSFCKGECEEKFVGKTAELTACASGCTRRGQAEDGMRGFVACHDACASAHNETDGERAASPERQACDFACSLPMTKVIMMKVDYGSGDAPPKVEVTRKDGGDLLTKGFGLGPDFDQLILRPSDINGELAPGAHRKEAAEEEERELKTSQSGWNVPGGVLSNMFKIRTGDEELDKMQDRLNALVNSFFNRAQLASKVASERPHGHEDMSFLGSSVGNEDVDGHQILFVAPMEGQDWVDLHDFENQRESSIRRRFPALFQWTVCLILLVAILCTMIVALLMMRQMRLHRYRALRSQMATGTAATMGASGMEAVEVVKKVPIEDDEQSLPLPSGVPPPAYDQLSVHAKRSSLE